MSLAPTLDMGAGRESLYADRGQRCETQDEEACRDSSKRRLPFAVRLEPRAQRAPFADRFGVSDEPFA